MTDTDRFIVLPPKPDRPRWVVWDRVDRQRFATGSSLRHALRHLRFAREIAAMTPSKSP